tara:strand:- start:2729 stop:5410 length:2682 start_codon:yes stop_codon:yes gene_type:complete
MAQKDITIRIKTVETQLNQSLRKIEKLEKTVKRLSQKKVKLDTSAAEQAAKRLRKEIEKGDKIVNKLFDSSRSTGFGNSIAKVNSQLSLVTKSFNAATSAAERQRSATALIAGNFKKMRMEATAFAQASGNAQALKGAAGGSVGNRLKEIKEFPKTILAGNKAMNILNGMLELAEENSKDFLDISKAIGEQLEKNKKIQASADKASGVTKKKNDIKNDQENLRKTERTAQRIKAIKEQTANIERRILDSSLSQATKDKLITNLKRSGLELDKKELELARQINIETQRNLTMEEKKQRRRGRIAQSTLIGGGFPLLFGGGPVQAIGGALGGGIGEAISPGGGFAGSIAATALVSKLAAFTEGVKNLAFALDPLKPDLDVLTKSLGLQGTETGKLIQKLRDAGNETAALAVATEKLELLVGKNGVNALETFGEDTVRLGNEFSKAMTQMQVALAEVINSLGILKAAANQLEKATLFKQAQRSEDPILKDLFEKRLQASKGFFLSGSAPNFQAVNDFEKQIIARQRFLNQKSLSSANFSNLNSSGGSGGRKDFSEFELNILNKRIELQKLSGSLLDEEVVKLKRGIIHAEAAMKFAQAEGDIGKNKIINAERLLKLNQLDLEVEKAKGKAFAENVLKPQMDAIAKKEQEDFDAGAALGKRLAAEVKIFNNLDKEIEKMQLLSELEKAKTVEQRANIQLKLHELDLGQEIHEVNRQDILDLLTKKERHIENNRLLKEQQQIAKDIQHTFAVEMSNSIKGLITGTMTLNQALSNVLNKMADAFLNVGLFGNVGGNLKKGGGLLGGIFGGFLANGGPAKAGRSFIVGERGPEVFTPSRSGMVTPNHALGGSTSVNVNVDASGSSVEGDGTQAEQLGEAISQAIQAELIQQKRPGGILYS